MTAIAFRHPVDKPLYPFAARSDGPNPQRVANDPASFEVTQDAASHVAAGRGTGTAAIDIGNGHCGEPVVAMAAGVAQRITDPSGALGVRVDHGSGVTSEYWHFNAWSIGPGLVPVSAGARLGYLGSTGLSLGGCHCHIEIKLDGRSIDPEPYVFGKQLVVLDKEDDVLAAKTQPLQQSIRVVTGAGNGIRTDTRIADATLEDRTVDQAQFTIIGWAAGDVFPAGSDNDRWGVFLKRGVGLRAIHSSVLQEVRALVDCAPQVQAATDPLYRRIDAMKAKVAALARDISDD